MMTKEVKDWLNEQFMGDENLISTVWAEYVSSTAEKIGKAKEALAAADNPQLDRLAHSLKGDALMVGDRPMAEAAIALRNASKMSDAAGAAKALERIVALDQENRA